MDDALQSTYSSEVPNTTEKNAVEVVERIDGFLPTSPSRVFEIGCGNGWVADRMSRAGHKVVAVDISESGIAIARKHFPSVEKFACASAYDDLLQFGSNFDVVLSSEVIEHLMLPKKLLQNAFRLLRPGGRLLLTTPYHGYAKNLALSLLNRWDHHHAVAWDGGHVKFFSKKSLTTMLREAGFVKTEIHGIGRAPLLWKSMLAVGYKP